MRVEKANFNLKPRGRASHWFFQGLIRKSAPLSFRRVNLWLPLLSRRLLQLNAGENASLWLSCSSAVELLPGMYQALDSSHWKKASHMPTEKVQVSVHP